MAKTNRPTSPPQTAAAAAFDVPSAEEVVPQEQFLPVADALKVPGLPANAGVSPEMEQLKPAPARQGDEGRPYCPKHQCLMRASGSTDVVTNYTCPVPTCTCSEKKARPTTKIPRDPMKCPQELCRERSGQQFLEVIDRLTNAATLHMQCPKCSFNVKVPRPQIAQLIEERRRRPPREDLLDA